MKSLRDETSSAKAVSAPFPGSHRTPRRWRVSKARLTCPRGFGLRQSSAAFGWRRPFVITVTNFPSARPIKPEFRNRDGEHTRPGCCFPRPRGKPLVSETVRSFFACHAHGSGTRGASRDTRGRVCSPASEFGLKKRQRTSAVQNLADSPAPPPVAKRLGLRYPLPLSPNELPVSAKRNPVGMRRGRRTRNNVLNHGNGQTQNFKMNPDEKQFSRNRAG